MTVRVKGAGQKNKTKEKEKEKISVFKEALKDQGVCHFLVRAEEKFHRAGVEYAKARSEKTVLFYSLETLKWMTGVDNGDMNIHKVF